MITKLIEPENSPNVMNKKVCPDFVRVFVCLHTEGYATESLAEASCF